MTNRQTLVIAGCGAAKQDGRGRYQARNLYTSTYFQKKREFAETVGDQWMILSAEHGLLPPGQKIRPYNTSIDDLDGDQLDNFTHRVGMTLVEWVAWENGHDRPVGKVIVLGGDRYVKPLRKRDAFYLGDGDERVVFPFQAREFEGIGDQMAWLKQRIQNASNQASLEGYA